MSMDRFEEAARQIRANMDYAPYTRQAQIEMIAAAFRAQWNAALEAAVEAADIVTNDVDVAIERIRGLKVKE